VIEVITASVIILAALQLLSAVQPPPEHSNDSIVKLRVEAEDILRNLDTRPPGDEINGTLFSGSYLSQLIGTNSSDILGAEIGRFLRPTLSYNVFVNDGTRTTSVINLGSTSTQSAVGTRTIYIQDDTRMEPAGAMKGHIYDVSLHIWLEPRSVWL